MLLKSSMYATILKSEALFTVTEIKKWMKR